jgi:hypothetical protein
MEDLAMSKAKFWIAFLAFFLFTGQIINPTNAPAASNMSFYISPSGADNKPCSNIAPCLTLQHVVNLANSYNWNDLYFPTINIGNGSYGSTNVVLPQLLNCANPNGGVITGNNTTPTNVALSDNGSAWTFNTAPNAIWMISGIDFHGTYGGIYIGNGGIISTGTVNFSGSLSNGGVQVQGTGSTFSASNLSTTTSAMGTLIFTRGVAFLDNATVTFVNPVTFTTALFAADAVGGQFYGDGTRYINGGNVTASSYGLIMTNGAFFESNGTSTVDSAAVSRYNFPGGSGGTKMFIDFTSRFQPDQIVSGNYFQGGSNPGSTVPNGTTNVMAWFDQSNTLRMDYNLTSQFGFNGDFTLNPAGGALTINGSADISPGILLNDTPNSGVAWGFGSGGGFFTLTNYSSGNFEGPFQVNSSQFQLAADLPFGWGNTAKYAGTLDSGISRLSAGFFAFGNGTQGDISGSLQATDFYSTDANFGLRSKTTLNNGASTNAGTLLNAPTAGNPTKWISIDDNGTTRRIPAW